MNKHQQITSYRKSMETVQSEIYLSGEDVTRFRTLAKVDEPVITKGK